MTLKELYKLRDELMFHVVGMTYNTTKILEISKEIKEKELKLKKGEKRNDDRSRL